MAIKYNLAIIDNQICLMPYYGSMSFFDIRYNKEKDSTWVGMKPPDLYLGSIITDLKWHNRIYKINELPLRIRIVFLILRTFQQFAYFFGWHKENNQL